MLRRCTLVTSAHPHFPLPQWGSIRLSVTKYSISMPTAMAERPGRPRTTSCTDNHRGPCARCARERAKRYRHGQKKAEIQKRDRARYSDRAAEVTAAATVCTALRRGTITPPGRCDNCGTRDTELHARHADPQRVRQIAWLCVSCARYLRAVGGEVVLHWAWPGAARPRPRRGRPRFSAESHAQALAAVREIPNGVEQYRAYAEHYLAAAGGRDRWVGEGLARGALWTPTPDVTLNRLWRWYVASWWDAARERYDRERWLGEEGAEVVRFMPAPIVERAPRIPIPSPVAQLRVSTPMPRVDLEAAIEHLDGAMAAFDARVAEIESRLARQLASHARVDDVADRNAVDVDGI